MDERAAPPLAPEAIVELHDPAGLLVRWYCTPERLEELAAGWLVGDGLAASARNLGPIEVDQAEGRVALTSPATDLRRAPAAIPEGPPRAPELVGALAANPDALRDLFKAMFERAVLRERTGGIHTGALVERGEVCCVREDVSRHCVVDKLIGHAGLAGSALDSATILLSGRVSGAIAAKAARAGVAALVTMSIPTTLAAHIAGRAGVTLIGRARAAAPHVYPPGS
jgi:FdhD protein